MVWWKWCYPPLVVQEQSKLMWKYRDELKNNLSKSELQSLLLANDQKVPKGESNVSAMARTSIGSVGGSPY